MKSLPTTTRWSNRMSAGLARSKPIGRGRLETRRKLMLESLEDRVVLSYVGSVDTINKIVTLTSDGNPTNLVITQSGGFLNHNAGSLLNVTGVDDWQSGGPATTVAADGSWILSITPIAGDTIQLGDATVAASNVPIQLSLVGTAGASLIINDISDTNGRSFDVSSSSVTGTGLAGTATFASGSVSSLSIQGGLGDDTFNLNSIGTGGVTTYTIQGTLGNDVLNANSSLAGLDFNTPGILTFTPGNVTVNYSSIENLNVTKPAVAPVGTARTINTTEGLPFTNAIVATFTATDLGNTASDFVASIDWGDGSPTSNGTIVSDGTSSYDIQGSHTYASGGNYTVNVTLTDLGSSGTTVVGSTTLTVTSQGPVASSPSPIVSTAVVAAASLTAHGVPVSGLEGIALAPGAPGATDVLVATFADSGTIGAASAYTASIDWGDGSTSTATRIVASGTANGTVFSVFGNHTYASVGFYPVITTITKTESGAVAIAASTATIVDAPLSAAPPQPTVNTTEEVYFSGPVGTFSDRNPSATIDDFKAIIDWGDGSPMSAGAITAVSSGGATIFQVSGSHTYADSIPFGKPGSGTPGPQNGTYPLTIYVTDLDGAAVTLHNTANVADEALTLSGQLDPASDSGASHTDAITNVTQPRFFGTTSERDAKVFVYGTAAGSGTRTLLGQTESDSNGAWSLTSGVALADGSYTITAQAIDDSNHTLSEVTTITPTLVIDTVGPKVTAVFLDRINGLVRATFQDYGGVSDGGVGLNQSTVVDANNYRYRLLYSPFRPKHVPKFLVTSISVDPGNATGPQVATVVINNGRYQRGGHFLFTARSIIPSNLTGIQDIAGNALDGEFYKYFPSGNNHVGGDFVAELDSVHHRVYAPRTVIGPATPVSPPGTPGTDTYIPTYLPSKSVKAPSTVKLSRRKAVASVAHPSRARTARVSAAQVHSLTRRHLG